MINKGRRNPIQRDGPAGKRRKISEGKYKEMSQTNKHPMSKREEKRRWKDEAAETEKDQEPGCSQPKRKKLRQMRIGETILETPR